MMPEKMVFMIYVSMLSFMLACGSRDVTSNPESNDASHVSEISHENQNDNDDHSATLPQTVDDTCERFDISLKPYPNDIPRVVLLVDRSTSMGTTREWENMVTTLLKVTESLQDMVAFGLMLFPSATLNVNMCGAAQLNVPIQLHQAQAIAQALRISPFGSTPTADSLLEAARVLAQESTLAPLQIVLATDGGPGCNLQLNPTTCTCIQGSSCQFFAANCLDDVRTLQTVQNIYARGMITHVIGVPGSESVSALLDQMAIAGGAAHNGHYYQVTDRPQLEAALRASSTQNVACRYLLPHAVQEVSKLTIQVDGQAVEYDEHMQSGWFLSENDTIIFIGEACEALRDGAEHMLTALYTCNE